MQPTPPVISLFSLKSLCQCLPKWRRDFDTRGKPIENPNFRSPRDIDAANPYSLENSAMGTRRLAASMCSRYFSSAAASAPSSSAAASGNSHLPQITLLCKQFLLRVLRKCSGSLSSPTSGNRVEHLVLVKKTFKNWYYLIKFPKLYTHNASGGIYVTWRGAYALAGGHSE